MEEPGRTRRLCGRRLKLIAAVGRDRSVERHQQQVGELARRQARQSTQVQLLEAPRERQLPGQRPGSVEPTRQLQQRERVPGRPGKDAVSVGRREAWVRQVEQACGAVGPERPHLQVGDS